MSNDSHDFSETIPSRRRTVAEKLAEVAQNMGNGSGDPAKPGVASTMPLRIANSTLFDAAPTAKSVKESEPKP